MKNFILGLIVALVFLFTADIFSNGFQPDSSVILSRIEKELKQSNRYLEEIRNYNKLIAEKLSKF